MTGNNSEARSASRTACQAEMSHHSLSAVALLRRSHPRKLGHRAAPNKFKSSLIVGHKSYALPLRTPVISGPSLHIDYKGTSIVASQGGASLRNRNHHPQHLRLLRQEQLACAPAPLSSQPTFKSALSRTASQRASALHFADPQVQILWRLCCCSNYFPQVFRIAIYAHNSHLCSATRRETSLRGK